MSAPVAPTKEAPADGTAGGESPRLLCRMPPRHGLRAGLARTTKAAPGRCMAVQRQYERRLLPMRSFGIAIAATSLLAGCAGNDPVEKSGNRTRPTWHIGCMA